jgi:hypothetical protein
MKKQEVTEQVMFCLCDDICKNGSRSCCPRTQGENTTGKHCLDCPDLHWKDSTTFYI